MALAGAFFDSAARNAARTAVIAEGRAWSYRELADAAGRLAERLPAETDSLAVGIYLANSAEFVASFLGILAAGRVAVPLNTMLAERELAWVLSHSGASAVVAPGAAAAKLSASGARALAVESLLAPGPAAAPAARGDDELAIILYTSGSTGLPRGVCLSHRNLMANALGAAELAGFVPADHVLGALPPFHTFALTATMIAPLLIGASVVTMARFSPEAALDLSAEGVSVILGVPSMYRLMARAQKANPRKMPALRLPISGGERLPEAVRAEFREAFGLDLCEGYGLTECSPVVALNVPEANRPGTVGRVLRHLEVRIADAGGRALPAGDEGEVQVRGASVMMGYHRDPEATAKVISTDGWLATGDLGRMSGDGFLTLTGRIKELIIVGGENVHPGEVEAALARHPAVAECAVIGALDERRGEQVVAFLVPRAGAPAPGTPELREHCRQELAGYKVPRRFVLVAQLPKGPTGKADRKALGQMVAGQMEKA